MNTTIRKRLSVVTLALLVNVPANADVATDAKQQIARIQQLDDAGPQINAVLVFDAQAPNKAAQISATSLLAGRTVLIKDNIETAEWPTTAGSLALKSNRTLRDAPLIANLRSAGGIVLGKTNLSEWANFRDDHSTSGWSAIGGLTKNPHALDRNSCGSSSGSGAAIAAGFAWGAIGTETNGSIVCPASLNGIVGFKPSVGLVSRTHVIPISPRQDTAGPMTQTVADAALLLTAIAGPDPQDPVTLNTPLEGKNYTAGLGAASLRGVRLGVMTQQLGSRAHTRKLFTQATTDLRRAGAELVAIDFTADDSLQADHYYLLAYDFARSIDAYLQSLPGTNLPRSLKDLIDFNQANQATEMRYFGQSVFAEAASANDPQRYKQALERTRAHSGATLIDQLLEKHQVDFLIAPTIGPAWYSDLINGDSFFDRIGFGSPPARGGYPHLTVPMGAVQGLPVGLSIIGSKWQDHEVLKAGAAYERSRSAVLPKPSFKRWSPPSKP
ncbi:MAG: amidase [Pseudomonadales bacterium]